MAAAGIAALFLPCYTPFTSTGNNMFSVSLNGQEVGRVESKAVAEEILRDARREVARQSEELVFLDADLEVTGQEVLYGLVDTKEDVRNAMMEVLKGSVRPSMQQAFTVKINDFTVNLGSLTDVLTLLQAPIDKYDTTGDYKVSLTEDADREINALTARVESESVTKEKLKEEEAPLYPETGIFSTFTTIYREEEGTEYLDMEDYNIGLISMEFGDTVEVVETYMSTALLSDLSAAIEEVTKEQETNKIYEVQSGDTLSEISEQNGLSMEELIAMNPTIENENSMIRVGDEIIITVPEPELSVNRVEELYIEEYYDAPIEYVPNDEWYTTQTKTLQQPSAGYRRIVALVNYRNNEETGREIIMEDVVMEAVPKIVERGTKIPPTYIKPISGGRFTSGFGRRKRPTKGASTYHKGVDWSTPVGTAVMASSGGTVVKAGWGTGYGNVVYIQHADGRQTRYGHLSKILVSVGQHVSQGQKIALSGNTGVSTGPHLHFEILINGVQVNPLNYLN
ncbi:MAG: M23 family metallopeptidase [Lachnospiraceae bacterium]|nr:M23 family metallopeptidase [Lachnospiraceae bacterium]